MSSNNSGTIVRIVVLLVILAGAGAGFLYMQNRKPSMEAIEAEIRAGALWGEPLEAATDLFQVDPVRVENERTDSPSAERWLYKVHSDPPQYYLIFVQTGKITQAQLANEQGTVLPK